MTSSHHSTAQPLTSFSCSSRQCCPFAGPAFCRGSYLDSLMARGPPGQGYLEAACDYPAALLLVKRPDKKTQTLQRLPAPPTCSHNPTPTTSHDCCHGWCISGFPAAAGHVLQALQGCKRGSPVQGFMVTRCEAEASGNFRHGDR